MLEKNTTQPKTPADHPKLLIGKVGFLLVNLGTPDAATPGAVRRYLAEFLSDKRVVDLPRALWLPLLHGVILNVRPAATARNYKKIWRTESDESPLRYYTRAAAEALAARQRGAIQVSWAMRYGSPSIRDQIAALQDAGCDRIVVAPLYPQYSATTTASVTDAVFTALQTLRWQPAIRIAPPFHDEPIYIDALAQKASSHLAALEWSPEKVILSFHGIPQRYFDNGDPYHCHCAKTARLLRAQLGWTDDFAPLAFQSKFGREKWLEPATDKMITDLAESGVKNLALMAPSFVADCIETLEELDIAGREAFIEAGGENFTAIACLNDSPAFIDVLDMLANRETAGWRG